MQIERKTDGDLLELTVSGVLDNESSSHFRNVLDDCVRDGWHRIIVHMQDVNYISSAGISVLISTKKRLGKLKGLFGICDLTEEVQRVLSQTRLLDLLQHDVEQARSMSSVGDYTRSLTSRIESADGLDLQIYGLDKEASLRCRVIGDAAPLFDSAFTDDHSHSLEITSGSTLIGLGALGGDFDAASSRFGECIAVAGAFAQSSQSRRQLPDYSLSQGDFSPSAQVLYGIQCEGPFSHLIRFQPVEAGAPVEFSAVIRQCLAQVNCSLGAVVLLAETAGLLGGQLRRAPTIAAGGEEGRFAFPEVRDWLSFSTERTHSRNLALIAGVAKTSNSPSSTAALDALLRPLDRSGNLQGHFHVAVFPYSPMKKRTLDMQTSIREQFESGTIQDVLHLLRDDRPIVGAGESELLSGAGWVSPIHTVVTEESNG